MKGVNSPFVLHDGRWYLIVNFSLDNDQPPPSPKLLGSLIRRHGADNIVVLRRLTDEEANAVSEALDDAVVDAWAHVVGSERER